MQPLAFGVGVHRLPHTYSRIPQQAHRTRHNKWALKLWTRQQTKGTEGEEPTTQPVIYARTRDACTDMTLIHTVEGTVQTRTRSWFGL